MAHTRGEARTDGRARGSLGGPARVLYLAATVLLVVYAVTLFVQRTGHVWAAVDNQLVAAFEVALALGCLAAARRRRPERPVALLLGTALLAWALGDVVRIAGPSPSTPSVAADAFSLAFYPLACLALVVLVRSEVGRIRPSAWLDGAMAGLGAAAICAVIALDTILGAAGGSAADLAYATGDLVLLGLAVGAVVVVPRHQPRLLLLAAGSR